jgi:AraC-like DNA-binding protein
VPLLLPPSPELSGLIESYWFLPRRDVPGASRCGFFTDGHFALGFVLGEGHAQCFLGGPNTRPLEVQLEGGLDYLMVRFRPGKLPRFGDVPPAALVDATAEGPTRLLGLSAADLGERLRQAGEPAGQRAVWEDLFRRRPCPALWQDRRARWAVERVGACGGRIGAASLAHELGLSLRTLERLFREQVGLPPQSFIRHVRFQTALARLKAGPARGTLARVALECGYADQSHFIKDFQALAGRRPGELIVSRPYNPVPP